MTNGVLTLDDCTILQLCSERDALLRTDGWQHRGALRDACYTTEQEHSTLQGAKEHTSTSKEEIAWQQQHSKVQQDVEQGVEQDVQ